MDTKQFKKIIWDYYRKEGRHDLPWRKTRDPYRILVSEIMLQQTQVARVMKFYPKFIKQFPGFRSLARATPMSVLWAWQGLGYNRRALNLKKLSTIVLEEFNGRLPRDREALESLPGIGKGTSGAVRAFAFDEPEIFIETNIRRLFVHFFFPRKKNARKKVTDSDLERCIEGALDTKNPREWYWALMDYGAMLGIGSPELQNPNRRSAHYKKQSTFKGSNRELRGKILRLLLKERRLSLSGIARETGEPIARAREVASGLVREGFAKQKGSLVSIAE